MRNRKQAPLGWTTQDLQATEQPTPTTSTVGYLGQVIFDTDGNKWELININGSTYTWSVVGAKAVYSLSVNQTTGLAIGDKIKIDTVDGHRFFPSPSSSNQIVLLAGSYYWRINIRLNLTTSGVSGGVRMYKDNTVIESTGCIVYGHANVGVQSSLPSNQGILTLAETSNIDLRFILATATSVEKEGTNISFEVLGVV